MAQVAHFLSEKMSTLTAWLSGLPVVTAAASPPVTLDVVEWREDHNVIQVQKQGLTLLVSKNPLHEPLKGARCIAKPKGHVISLGEPERSTKCHLKPVRLCHQNLVVPTG